MPGNKIQWGHLWKYAMQICWICIRGEEEEEEDDDVDLSDLYCLYLHVLELLHYSEKSLMPEYSIFSPLFAAILCTNTGF